MQITQIITNNSLINMLNMKNIKLLRKFVF